MPTEESGEKAGGGDLKKLNVGDEGQRYEHWCKGPNGRNIRLGWDDDAGGVFARHVKAHPALSNHWVIDRKKG